MPVYYNSSKIIPAPLVRFEKEVERNATGHKKRSFFAITVQGTMLPDKGSPNSSGTLWTTSGYPPDETITLDSRMAALRAKQGALCQLFCQEGKWLEFQPPDGSAPIKCQPRLRSSTFSEGLWVQKCDYTFTFETDRLYFGSVECCADDSELDPCDESWTVEQADDAARTYRLTHSVAATFRDKYATDGTVESEGWERAKTAVTARLGFQASKLEQSGVLGLSSLGAYNHARSVDENRSDGSYRVTETWLCFDVAGGAAAVEDYTITTRTQAGRSTVSTEGSINGLLTRNSDFSVATTKYAGAAAKWTAVQSLLLSRAQASSGLTLNPNMLSLQVARNELTGVINYSCEMDNRYQFGDAVTFDIQINDQLQSDVYASIPVVARLAGPVLQNIGSTTETTRTVSIDAQFNALTYGGTYTKPDVSALVLAYVPLATQVFVAKNDENWSPTSGRYQRTVVYSYQ